MKGTSKIPALHHSTAKTLPTDLLAKDTLCKDNKTMCISGTSCCKDYDRTYNCCPIKEAICCHDHIHCCPVGWICNTAQGE